MLFTQGERTPQANSAYLSINDAGIIPAPCFPGVRIQLVEVKVRRGAGRAGLPGALRCGFWKEKRRNNWDVWQYDLTGLNHLKLKFNQQKWSKMWDQATNMGISPAKHSEFSICQKTYVSPGFNWQSLNKNRRWISKHRGCTHQRIRGNFSSGNLILFAGKAPCA